MGTDRTESYQSAVELVSDPRATDFLRALDEGLHGEAGRMQQLLRRSLHHPPEALSSDTGLLAALSLLAAQADPPLVGSARAARRGPSRRHLPTRDEGFSFLGQSAASDTDRASDVLLAESAGADRPLLNADLSDQVDAIVQEWTSPHLSRWGVDPTATALFVGPPGTGKSMTARWLAGRLDRPFFVLNLATVTNRELGESAKNLTEALNFVQHGKGILFLDELDAVASSRAESNDVGEMRRLVNVLLLALDRWDRDALLIAATNHPDLLDPAVTRRFDEVLYFEAPDEDARASMWAETIADLTKAERQALAAISEGATGSDIATTARRARRKAALANRPAQFTDVAFEVLTSNTGPRNADRDALLGQLRKSGLTFREIGRAAGISHVAAQDAVKRAEALEAILPGKSTRKR